MTTVSNNDLRKQFAAAMSTMYQQEVPLYGSLKDLVESINSDELDNNRELADQLMATRGLTRLAEERHGAIRLGTAKELSIIRRLFAVMGMSPVGYYDLSVAGIPVHSTAFRPLSHDDLSINAFRVFTSLLRLD
ncbi:MAG: putative glyoxalase superfamily metalloenzyme YdcJ, partial [Candidatus Endobugula sp.]